jgi:predicted RNA-binding Zn-ribbon protein involved in translation (DUF1610 family)
MRVDDTSYQALLANIQNLETEKASLQILIAELVLKNQQFREALAENGIVFVPSIESTEGLLLGEMRRTHMASTAPNKPNHSLLHVHVCNHCGTAFRREVLEGRAHITGIFRCPKCGVEGPLNLEIREMNESDSGLSVE